MAGLAERISAGAMKAGRSHGTSEGTVAARPDKDAPLWAALLCFRPLRRIVAGRVGYSKRYGPATTVSRSVVMNDMVKRLADRPLVHREQRVITLRMMDELHQRTEGTAKRNFRENREKLIEGDDYFM